MRTSATIEKPEQQQAIFMSSNIERPKKIEESTLPLYSDTKKKDKPLIEKEAPQVELGTLSYSSQSNYQSYGLGSLSDKSGPSGTDIPSYQHNFNKNNGKIDDLSHTNLEKW